MENNVMKTDVNQFEVSSIYQLNIDPTIKELLTVSIEIYFQNRIKDPEGASFGMVMIAGPSGCGKSLLARALHGQLCNLNLIEVNGELLNNTSELISILLSADNETTLFLDEAHCTNVKNQNILLTAIMERKLYLPKTKNSNTKREIPLSNFVPILATTHLYSCLDALRNRARLLINLDYPTIETLTEILKQRADALGWRYESIQVIRELASRAKFVPRLAINRNLQMAWNICSSQDRDMITMKDVGRCFYLLQIDQLGLDQTERNYLKELSRHGKMKLNILASKLGLPRNTVSAVLEPFMIRQELIYKDGSTRVITDAGISHVENYDI